ncbi:hypothetical protein PENTCL1PPCAC_14489, partial [Pristionchus entomophagus]
AILGVGLNLFVFFQLIRKRFSSKVVTYHVGIAIAGVHGIAIAVILAGVPNTIHLFHFDQYIVFFCEFVVFMSFWLAHIIWELVPANCILQYIALCKPQFSTPVRLTIAYGYCSLLLSCSSPYCAYFYQDSLYDNTTREVHELTDNERFMAFGGRLFASDKHLSGGINFATQSILPTYFAAYGVFI